MKYQKTHTAFVAAFVAALLFNSCTTVPVTGRKQLNLVSDSELVKMTMGTFEQMKQQMKISKDPKANDMLTDVGYKISQQVFWDVPLADWEFVVFDMPNDVNAFAMPGGKVGIFTGLFRIVTNEDELAAVIGHEIAHVTAKHTHERLSQMIMMESGGTILSLGSGMTLGGLGNMAIMSIYGMNASGATMSWDREKEAEADRIGLMYMARAGYNPEAAITVMERMVALDGGGVQSTTGSTHPSSLERLDALHTYLPEAVIEYQNAKAIEF